MSAPPPVSGIASAMPPSPPRAAETRRPFATLRTMVALMLREMGTRYGASPGGYAWAVLEPLGAILILGIGFSLVLRSPSLGNSFILFYATGFLPFQLYNSVANTVARALAFSKPLLMYPSVTWIDAILARFALNTLTGFAVAALLLSGLVTVTGTRLVLDLGAVVTAMTLAAGLGLGIGTLNCLISGLLPAWDQVWSIVTRPLFLASGVIYIYEDLPRAAQEVLWYNPLMHVTGLMREGFYPTYSPGYVSLSFVSGVALLTLTAGLLLLRRHHKRILSA